MATAETVDLGLAHPPKEGSINAFNEIEIDLKKMLQHLRHEHDKHEPEYFAAVKHLSNEQLTNFSADNLKEVRVAQTAYGLHLLGKVLLPDSGDRYFMFRAFIPGEAETARLHSIHTEEVEKSDGDKVYRAIFLQNDPLEWFDT
ncbi:hypothetical protein WAI453_003902 [Rhynchosporium graminicola]|uniref:Uncharacterized protein n=1 Tax=Rhynchosporium graminicola TaxID=2792576 RepID=A0A1E1JYV6_9HELO|nr:uncharacterized protein RCO7_06676 [Rhynchosporium commune]